MARGKLVAILWETAKRLLCMWSFYSNQMGTSTKVEKTVEKNSINNTYPHFCNRMTHPKEEIPPNKQEQTFP